MIELFIFIVANVVYILGNNYIGMKAEYKEWLEEQKHARKHYTDNVHHEHKRKYGGIDF